MKFNKYIDDYINGVRSGKIIACENVKKSLIVVEEKLSEPNVYIDNEKIEIAIVKIEQYFKFELLDWEKYIIALVHCYYNDDTLVFTSFLIMMGRGNGKNGFISGLAWYLTTEFHGIKKYNVDIVANCEDQAKTSFDDVYEVIDDNKNLKKAFKYTKEIITFKKTRSYIRYRTSNAKTKDGLRPACIIFDEIHEYETYDNINVFKSALGKKKHPRIFMITTNGKVRGGVLDDYLEIADGILNRENTKSRMYPFLCSLDSDEEVHDKRMWHKANPSLKGLKTLRDEMEQEYNDMETEPHTAITFMTKRMNRPAQSAYTPVAPWEDIKATNQPIPELLGFPCIGGVDYASVKDFVGVGLLFKYGEKRIWIHHSFICRKALTMPGRKFKFDIELAREKGLCTIISEDTIDPKYVVDWFIERAGYYNILNIKADRFRRSLLKSAFNEAGLPLNDVGNGYATHNKLAPLIEQLFAKHNIVYGDDMMMRWYTNNVYVDIDKKENKSYKKIEPMLRKTDGFFALLHALTEDENIPQLHYEVANVSTNVGCVSY